MANVQCTHNIGKGKELVNWIDGGTTSAHVTVIFDTVKVKNNQAAIALLEDVIKSLREKPWRPK